MRARGVALVSGLVVLTALSLLALTAAGGMTLQRRQSANFQDRVSAEAGSERAQAAARAWLYSRADDERQAGCVTGCFLPPAIHPPGSVPVDVEFLGDGWWAEHAHRAPEHPLTGESNGFTGVVANDARWLLTEIHYESLDSESGGVTGIGYYRILGRAKGRQPGTVVVTEAIVARPWDAAVEPLPYPPSESLSRFCAPFAPGVPCGVLAWRTRR